MKIYKLIIVAYDYWFKCDKDGFVTIEKFFANKVDAEKWIAENPNYIYRGFDKEQTTATKKWQMPNFQIVEVEVA